ncbi:Probable transcriptional regulatory protein PERMA_0079 [Anthophora quadrimaculata]
MSYRLNILLFNKYKNVLIQESKRYAGHSKWQNIKSTKQSQDAARSLLFKNLASKMKVIVEETGNSDPDFNPKLANLIDQAKKANMPASTLKTILSRIQSNRQDGQIHIVTASTNVRVVLILHVLTNNLTPIKFNIITILKKANAKISDTSVLSMFDCASYVAASKDCSLDQAMENAIQADAQDVAEGKHEDNKCFMFKTDFLFPDKVITQLKNLGYEILSTENKCIPTDAIELSEEELKYINKLKQKLSEIREIKKIEDNIASS